MNLQGCYKESQQITAAKQNCASAGNRTRIYCLEGNNASLYTTDARYKGGKVYHIGSFTSHLILVATKLLNYHGNSLPASSAGHFWFALVIQVK